jgi:hypothetical protein
MCLWVKESGILQHVGATMTNNYGMNGANVERVQGTIVGHAVNNTHVYHWAPYDSLHMDMPHWVSFTWMLSMTISLLYVCKLPLYVVCMYVCWRFCVPWMLSMCELYLWDIFVSFTWMLSMCSYVKSLSYLVCVLLFHLWFKFLLYKLSKMHTSH